MNNISILLEWIQKNDKGLISTKYEEILQQLSTIQDTLLSTMDSMQSQGIPFQALPNRIPNQVKQCELNQLNQGLLILDSLLKND